MYSSHIIVPATFFGTPHLSYYGQFDSVIIRTTYCPVKKQPWYQPETKKKNLQNGSKEATRQFSANCRIKSAKTQTIFNTRELFLYYASQRTASVLSLSESCFCIKPLRELFLY